ncbi:MAG: 2-C-methyl-D-erythritol 2,4-cyclodiphosphate synthase [Anaerohalosphaeraceae bacterium]|nr:2-C-methyl-D-erythritol 2,4-cyclodiphosphate synthase [Anaerohalosphaeraceae bacterium]
MNDLNYEYRVGLGRDIHRLIEDKPLKLGGVLIEFDKGLLAHSDGDVALHAAIDALLGAAGLGDIGTMFPDSDPQFMGIDSKKLFIKSREYICSRDWEIVNLDLTITAEAPRLEPHKPQMKRCIASLLGIDFMCVNVKAKTNEGLGEVGQGLAISAEAICLLRRRIKRSL